MGSHTLGQGGSRDPPWKSWRYVTRFCSKRLVLVSVSDCLLYHCYKIKDTKSARLKVNLNKWWLVRKKLAWQLKDSASYYSLSCHVYNTYCLVNKSELVRKGALWIWSCWQALVSAREIRGTAAPSCQGWVMGFVQIQEFFY